MEFRQLVSFVETARAGSYAGASRRLHVAQPAVWKHVNQLETELGVPLFARVGRGVQITESGRALLVRAEQLLAGSARFEELARDLHAGRVGRVTIGCVAPHVIGFLAPLLGSFRHRHPGVQIALVDVDIREGATEAFGGALRSGAVDVVFGPPLPGVDSFAVYEASVVCAVPDDHRWRATNAVPVEDLDGEPLLVTTAGYFSRRALERACRAHGFEPQIAFESDSPSVLVQLGAVGFGVPIVGADSLPPLSETWPTITADGKPLRSPVWCSANEHRDPPTSALIDIARACAAMTTDTLTPEVVAPVPGSNPPWGAPSFDVGTVGYTVEEFYVGGATRAYDLASGADYSEDGRWAAVNSTTAPYLTRILVVRPQDPAAFNGTVVLNWQNVSAGYEYGALAPGDEVFGGYAWVGVSAQEVGLNGFFGRSAQRGRWGNGRPLREQDPQRYGPLRHPGDRGSFEIYAQAGRAVGPTRGGDVDPMGGLEVERVIAVGASQSAMRLVAYANAVHPLDPVVDGFLLGVWEGRAPRLTAGGEDFYYVRTTLRADLETPTVIVNSEFEVLALAGLEIEDHDTRRLWEVAGTAHGVWPGPVQPDSRGVIPNPLSHQPVQQAALRQLHRWLADGTPAPHQERIRQVAEPRPAIERDQIGNALGGVRLPDLEAPTHEHRGIAFGTGFPLPFGASQPLTPDELRARYPSRAAFVQRWTDAVDRLVDSGALRPEDAGAMKARADLEAGRIPVADEP